MWRNLRGVLHRGGAADACTREGQTARSTGDGAAMFDSREKFVVSQFSDSGHRRRLQIISTLQHLVHDRPQSRRVDAGTILKFTQNAEATFDLFDDFSFRITSRGDREDLQASFE
jgi:hypothetical protein